MPQSHARIIVHLVFSTKCRRPVLTAHIRTGLFPYISAVLKKNDCHPLQVGGVEDHVHILFGMPRSLSIAEIVEAVKANSSRWIKSQGDEVADFHWQRGYAAFSVSYAGADRVVRYIQNQEEHHRRVTFQPEYRTMLESSRILYDERFMWD